MKACARRGGISSEAFSEHHLEGFTKKTFTKDDATKKLLTDCVKKNFLFSHLDEKENNDFVNAMSPLVEKEGTVISNEGDNSDDFYIIEEGEVEIKFKSEVVASLGAGESFGELALIHGTPHTATVTTKSHSKLWALDRETYHHMMMVSTIRKRKMYDSFLSKIPILESLSTTERLTVADALEPVTFQENDVVFNQGDSGEEFYIIVEGKAEVLQSKNDEEKPVVVGTLGSSDYFGEIALILDRPRVATVRSVGKLDCVKLDRTRFERVLGPCKEILKSNIGNYDSYICLSPSPCV